MSGEFNLDVKVMPMKTLGKTRAKDGEVRGREVEVSFLKDKAVCRRHVESDKDEGLAYKCWMTKWVRKLGCRLASLEVYSSNFDNLLYAGVVHTLIPNFIAGEQQL